MGLLSRLEVEKRSTVYDPIHPRDPALARLFGDTGRSVSGINVTDDVAMSSTAMFAGVRFIAENMASVPLKLLKEENRNKDPQKQDPRWWLLQSAANEEQTAMEFREMLIGFALTCGNGYAEIVEGSDGLAAALWPIVPWRVRTARAPNGKLYYLVRRPTDEREVPIAPEYMIHLRGFSRNGLLGEDVIYRMREALGITIAADRAAGTFFAKGAMPSGVLTTDGVLSKDAWERMVKTRDVLQSGVDNFNKLALLEEGVKWQQLTTDPEKSQLLETRKFQIAEVARILNLPLHILKELDRSTNNNIEHQGIELVAYTFRTWAVRFEQVLERRLLLPSERGTHLIKHNLAGFIRGDMAARYAAYAVGRQWGWLSANDVLEMEDRNGIGDQGDVYMAPFNMVPADKFKDLTTAQPPTPPEPVDEEKARRAQFEARVRQSWLPVFRQRFEELRKREANAIRRHLKKANTTADLRALLRAFYNENTPFAAAELLPAVDGVSRQLVDTDDPDFETEMRAIAEAVSTSENQISYGLFRHHAEGDAIEASRAAVEAALDAAASRMADEQAARSLITIVSKATTLAAKYPRRAPRAA